MKLPKPAGMAGNRKKPSISEIETCGENIVTPQQLPPTTKRRRKAATRKQPTPTMMNPTYMSDDSSGIDLYFCGRLNFVSPAGPIEF
jgi:hypothetical protein